MPTISLHGRPFGYDSDTLALIRNGIEGGYGDQTVTAASTASNIVPRGLTTLGATAAKAYTLTAPIAGLTKRLISTGSSTGMSVTLAGGATYQTTAGSTFTTALFTARGQSLILEAASTSSFLVSSNLGTVTFST